MELSEATELSQRAVYADVSIALVVEDSWIDDSSDVWLQAHHEQS
jgi:hypothetical protein